jgi:ElaB/YqjD/DUF883 family membrane-anchored ribosome-binding protein
MEKTKEEITRDVERTRARTRAAVENANDVWTGRNAVASAWRSTKGTYFRAQDAVLDTAHSADQTVRSNIYSSVGIALGLGAILGFFLTAKSSSRKRKRKC